MVSEVGSLRGVSGRCLSEGAGGRGRRGPDLRVPESAGVAAGGGAGSWARGPSDYVAQRVQLGDGGRAVRRRSWRRWSQGTASGRVRSAPASRAPSREPARSRDPPTSSTCEAWAVNDESRELSGDAPDAPGEDARDHAARAARATASWRWARTCRSRPRCARKLGYGEVRGCYYGKLGRTRPSRGHVRRRRDVRLRHRPLRRREGPVSLPRRALLDRALRRTDRASVRRPDAPDVRGEPHPEAGRTPGADHAEHRGAARDLGDPAGLSSRASSTPTSSRREVGRSGRAPQSRVHAARDSPACWRTPASK